MSKRRLGWIVAAVAFLPICCLVGNGAVWLGEVPIRLVLGWLAFASDAVGRVRWDPLSILVSLVVSGAFVVGVHRLGTWLRASRDPGSKAGWSRRTSLALSGLIAVTFLASIASICVIHQVGWLARSQEPLLVSSWDRRVTAFAAGSFCQTLRHALASPGDSARASGRLNRALARQADFHAIPAPGPDGGSEFLLLPIDPHQRLSDAAYRCDPSGEISGPLAAKDWATQFKDLTLAPYLALDSAAPDAGPRR